MKSYNISEVKILIVDASLPMRELLRHLLKALNVKQMLFLDLGSEALRQIRLYGPDLVLVDWLCGDMSGLEVVKALRRGKQSSNPYVSIIMMSGLTSLETIRAARDAGISEFLAKPISPKSLYEKVCHVIERPRKFINAGDYFGPDRRRQQYDDYGHFDRRAP